MNPYMTHLQDRPPNTYAWIVEVDKIADPTEEAPCNCNAVGMVGPRDARVDDDGKPTGYAKSNAFRMYVERGNCRRRS